jgi:hypothetical protein
MENAVSPLLGIITE